jgi:cold shock CspA family protein
MARAHRGGMSSRPDVQTVVSHMHGDGRTPGASPARPDTRPQPAERRGVRGQGRIVKLLVGQGHGFIRLESDREIYFHRADLHDGTSVADFHVGDRVVFELLEDSVSGARALRVKPHRPRR